MRNDDPDAAGLVAIALQAFRDEILPVVPAEQRLTALMIANALGIAGRELEAAPADDADPDLCRAIAEGRYDAPGKQQELRTLLMQRTRDRLAIANPKRLRGG